MSGSLRWLTLLSLGGLMLACEPVFAQVRRVPAPTVRPPTYAPSVFGPQFNPNPLIRPGLSLQQATYNMGVVGGSQANLLRAVGLTGPNLSRVLAARALGSSPYGPSLAPYALNTGAVNPFIGGGGGSSAFTSPGLIPYGLSTLAGANPYTGGSASLGASPYGSGYSMSTAGSSYGGGGGYGGYGGYGIPPAGATLMGLASYTGAAGRYWTSIEQARLMREEARRSAIDTTRKMLEFQTWWDTVRPTAPKMRAREMATDLDRARNDPPSTEVWSGRALNALLRSIQKTNRLNRGPNLELAEDTLKHINLTDSKSSGSVGMLKDGGKLTWPLSLQEAPFEKARRQLTRNLQRAVDQLKDKEPVDASLRKDIISDFETLNNTLASSAVDLSPAQYIEAKRYLNQLKGAVRALSDPNVVNYFNNTWIAKGKNVAELAAFMTKEGLQFAPAAPGDEAAYNALYPALRAFEAGVQTVSR